jgi:tetratricopeptide (TPR) repeat protein
MKRGIFLIGFLFFTSIVWGQVSDEAAAYRQLAVRLTAQATKADSAGNAVEALKLLQRAVAIDPQYAGAFAKSGDIYYQQENFAKAYAYYDTAIALEPSQPLYLQRAEVQMKLGNIEAARRDLKLAGASPDADNAEALLVQSALADQYYEQGMILLSQKKTDEAFDSFNEAILLDPNFAKAYLQKGLIFYDNADYSAAINNFDRVQQLQPESGAALYIVKAYLAASQTRKATEQYNAIDTVGFDESAKNLYQDVSALLAQHYIDQASLRIADGQADEALPLLQQSVAIDAENGEAYSYLGAVYFNKKNYEAAIAAYDRAIELAPQRQDYLNRGAARTELGDLEGAFADMSVVRNFSEEMAQPTQPESQPETITTEPAATDTIATVETQPAPPTPDPATKSTEPAQDYYYWIDRADEAFRANEKTNAREFYLMAQQADPSKRYPETQLNLLEQEIEPASVSTAKSYDQLVSRADYYYSIKAYKNAKGHYAQALELAPEKKYPALKIEEIDKLYLNDSIPAATSNKNDPENLDIDALPGQSNSGAEFNDASTALYNEGLRRYYDSDLSGALEKFKEAIAGDSSFVDAYFNSGFIKLNQADFEEAIADFDIVLSLQPNDKAWFYKGRALMGLRKFPEAVAQYTLAIGQNPQFFYAYNNRGNVLFQMEQYQAAADDFTAAIDINPDYVFAYNNRGNAYFKLNDYQAAIDDYNKAIVLRPDYGFAYLNRGITYEVTGQMDKACADWQKAAELGIQVGYDYYIEQCLKQE